MYLTFKNENEILESTTALTTIINPARNLIFISSAINKKPKNIAVTGLNPDAMAACVGVMINKARPQEYIINAPPGTAIINIANHLNPSNDNEPLKVSPKNNDNIKVIETPDTAKKP